MSGGAPRASRRKEGRKKARKKGRKEGGREGGKAVSSSSSGRDSARVCDEDDEASRRKSLGACNHTGKLTLGVWRATGEDPTREEKEREDGMGERRDTI